MTTRSAFSASRRIALRTLGASRRAASPLAPQVLLDERGERPFGLGPDGHRDAGRDEVEDDDRRAVVLGDGVGEADGELGVRAAADRHEDALDLARAALLDDGDVGRRLADDLVDGRGEDGGPVGRGRPGRRAPCRPSRR